MGKAGKIEIVISENGNYLDIKITDNGIGCTNIQKGFGLHHMQERLNLLKGKLEINGNNGFQIHAQIPIRRMVEIEL